MSESTHIVPPSGKDREVRITTRLKALVFTGVALGWLTFSVTAAVSDLSPQFHWWPVIRIAVWVLQGVLAIAAACFWRFERPREVKLPAHVLEPPVIHGV